jgi:hypothetical protein
MMLCLLLVGRKKRKNKKENRNSWVAFSPCRTCLAVFDVQEFCA